MTTLTVALRESLQDVLAPSLRGGKECSQYAPAGSPGRSRRRPPWSRGRRLLGRLDRRHSRSGGSAGTTEISFLYQNDAATQPLGKALIDGFEAENPDIKVSSRPARWHRGDNLIKTKLATGEMEDVFLLQLGFAVPGAQPRHQPQPLTDEPWAVS